MNGAFPEAKLARPEWKATVTIPAGKSPITLPLELTQNHPYAPFTINGKGPVQFLVRHRGPHGVMDAERAAALGLGGEGKEVLRGAGAGQLKSTTIPHPLYGLGPIQVPVLRAEHRALKALSLREGRALDAVMGYEVLSQFVVEFDYGGSALRFHDPDTFQAPAGAAVVPFTLYDTKPFVETAVELPDGRSIPAKMIIDTGSRAALGLATPFVNKHHLVDAVGKTLDAPLGFGVGGRHPATAGPREGAEAGRRAHRGAGDLARARHPGRGRGPGRGGQHRRRPAPPLHRVLRLQARPDAAGEERRLRHPVRIRHERMLRSPRTSSSSASWWARWSPARPPPRPA